MITRLAGVTIIAVIVISISVAIVLLSNAPDEYGLWSDECLRRGGSVIEGGNNSYCLDNANKEVIPHWDGGF